jgi:hypothetical protein
MLGLWRRLDASRGELQMRAHRALVGRLPVRRLSLKFKLGPVSTHVRAGAPSTLTVSLPAAALTGLTKHLAESVVFTLTVSNANGTGHATAGPAHLTGH